MRKVVPRPGSLSASMRQPNRSAMRRTMARPMPVPLGRALAPRNARERVTVLEPKSLVALARE